MKKIVIATHGTLAEGFQNTLGLLGAPLNNITIMNFYCDVPYNEESIQAHFQSLKENDQLIVFTDIQFGSVNQMFLKEIAKCRNKNVAILTGVNLPLILEVVTTPQSLSKEQLKEMVDNAAKQMTLTDVDAMLDNYADEDIF